VELKADDLAPRYAAILRGCTPFLVTYPGNLPALDLAPFGRKVAKQQLFDPTRLHSRRVIDGLHYLDAFSFGGQEMLMPRWVLFDCGEFPGIVFGFGKPARELGPALRAAYHVEGATHDDVYVPLSMWVAIRCAEDGAWFGHNLSSCNYVPSVAEAGEALPGLGTITKAYGVRLAKISKQYGATQWASNSLGLHLSLGDMQLLNAYTPAHTHEESFTYRIDVDVDRLVAPMRAGWQRESTGGDRVIDADDSQAIRALHDDIEAGGRFRLVRVEARGGSTDTQRLWVETLS
jgi:hypothetical protein